MPKSCGPGKIRRSPYTRKAYRRKSFSKISRSGKKISIKGSYVKRTKVGSTCVPAKGKALIRGRKTLEREKILPRPSGKLHLRKFGYTTKASEPERQMALSHAAKEVGDLEVLRHLNLLRNFQADP